MDKKNWIAVKVPYGGGYCSLNQSNPKGTKHAPDALEKEFERQSIFLADNGASVDQLEWYNVDIGLWPKNNDSDWLQVDKAIYTEALNLYKERGLKPLFLGGSHTITYSTVGALSATVGRNSIGLIVLDAHPDCCKKSTWPIHSDWLQELVRMRYILPENIILIGIRQVEKEEYDFLKRYGIKYYPMYKIGDPENRLMNSWSFLYNDLERIGQLEVSYLSVDIDFFSQAYAPGTGCPSPNGFSDREGLFTIKQFKYNLNNLLAADLVEISPLNRLQKMILRHDQTVDLGVKIIKEIVS